MLLMEHVCVLLLDHVCSSLACLPSDPLSHHFPDLLILQRTVSCKLQFPSDLLILQRTSSCKLQFPRLPALALTRLAWALAGHCREGARVNTGYFNPDLFASGDITVISAVN